MKLEVNKKVKMCKKFHAADVMHLFKLFMCVHMHEDRVMRQLK